MTARALAQNMTVAFSATADAPPTSLDFQRIYDNHAACVWRMLLRFGLAADVAEDALQEVFLVAFRRRMDFEGRSSIRTWLCGIAIRVAKRTQSRAYARAFREDAIGNEAPFRTHPRSEHAVERTEALRHAVAILSEMTSDRREVFLLCEIEQMTAPEVALALGVAVNTVYSRLRLAREDFERAARRLRERSGRRS